MSPGRSRWFVLTLVSLLLGVIGFWLYSRFYHQPNFLNPLGSLSGIPSSPSPKPLTKYSFTNLSQYSPVASPINLTSALAADPAFISYLFQFQTEGKKMTGQINVPQAATPSGGFPVILMVRGFVDPGIYTTGVGTRAAAAVFARAGYVTIAPDFFGFGGSDPPASDVMAERLEKPLNLLDLIASIPTLSFVNPSRLGIWAHSNGGQIALSLLEITGKSLPASLWAPVSKPFPYSILYYTDDSPDQGKALRQTLAQFEAQYDVFDFSIDRYFDRINGPLQIHQGTADTAVPLNWSQNLAATLKRLNKDVTLFIYPYADHNLKPGWDTVITRDLNFFNSYTTK